MRISDWSSDVCSSDFGPAHRGLYRRAGGQESDHARRPDARRLPRRKPRRRRVRADPALVEGREGGLMRLSALLDAPAQSDADPVVTGLAIDHRKVAPGTVFGAFPGARVNGEDFIPAAVEAGAIAIVARP